MTFRTPTAGRLVRPAVVSLLLLLSLPVHAAGTGGVDVTPYPGVVDGKQVTTFRTTVPASGGTTVRYALRNSTDKTASARLFAATAERGSDRRFTIGAAGSSPYISFTDRQVSLKPRETRVESFTVHAGEGGRPDGEVYGAVVVEVTNGSVIQRAATVVYLQPGRVVPLPLLVVLVAIAMLCLASLGFLLVARRRRSA